MLELINTWANIGFLYAYNYLLITDFSMILYLILVPIIFNLKTFLSESIYSSIALFVLAIFGIRSLIYRQYNKGTVCIFERV